MGEVADLILNGVLDYETEEYIGASVGYPRTIRKCKGKPKSFAISRLNEYGYLDADWKRMKKCTRAIIIYLYNEGFSSVRSRQMVMDSFFFKHNIFKHKDTDDRALPKNSRKYSILYDKFEEFKSHVKSYNHGRSK